MTTIIFVGPTLPATEVEARLPGATIVGPVSVGQVLHLVGRPRRERPTRIAIIDGYFERMAAVWHKEILLALEAGIEVWGAASMGALRAAELAPWGMRGVGGIYRDYARGTLVADDEVAVAHLPAEYGYRATSEALVDVRHALDRALGLTAKQRATLLALARARFYRDRTWDTLIADARTAKLPARVLARLAALPRVSRKAADAALLLRTLARTPVIRPPKLKVPRTWALAQLAPRAVDA